MNWNNYDNWRLSTPYDNEKSIECFETTEVTGYFSMDENEVNLFDKRMKRLKKLSFVKGYFMREVAQGLAENMELFEDESWCIEEYLDNEKSEQEYYLECKIDEEIEKRKGGY